MSEVFAPRPTMYPVRVGSRLDPELSRGLWLVKWLLAIPHVIVLAVLWIGFVLASIGAMFAILFTGSYPRALFDYNVGVLRWTWRVSFYAYGVLGTDRYPPFTLKDQADYPARLDIPYPQNLRRWLVLVKWWLFAIPHYAVLAFLVGGGYSNTRGGGLAGVLVVIAGVVLLVTGRYPRSIFDLLMGIQRWSFRVVAYAGLMTDEYPPFRLDLGADEPAR